MAKYIAMSKQPKQKFVVRTFEKFSKADLQLKILPTYGVAVYLQPYSAATKKRMDEQAEKLNATL